MLRPDAQLDASCHCTTNGSERPFHAALNALVQDMWLSLGSLPPEVKDRAASTAHVTSMARLSEASIVKATFLDYETERILLEWRFSCIRMVDESGRGPWPGRGTLSADEQL